jgi:precorrin-6A/cobalt-precorrin-6A reductase
VFLTVGRRDLTAFGGPHRYLVRSVDAPGDAPEGAVIVTARGPFTEADERALMLAHGIDCLVTKNAGGSAVAGKLAAARSLGIEVVMVRRPPPPAGPIVPDAAGALAWLHAHAALRGV